MHKFTNFPRFMQGVFDEDKQAQQAAEIGQGMLAARSLRLTDIAAHMTGQSAANYKRIQRFLQTCDPRQSLWRLFAEAAPFVIGDPTEIERPQAKKTEYVGTLKDGKTKGFWALLLATPYRGRAIPCGFVTYSSKTIAQQLSSRNLNHCRAFEGLKDLLGERPIVLDREFSYLELLRNLTAEQIHFVIRLNLGSHPPKFFDSAGQEAVLTTSPGQTVIHNGIWYKGQVRVNVIGTWKKGLAQAMWVMTDLEAQAGQRIYFQRMKIEESFRDLKSLLGLTKLMNKQQIYMEKMLALLLLVYTCALLLGEGLRDQVYGEPSDENETVPEDECIPGTPNRKKGKKWRRYSGIFVFLKQNCQIPKNEWAALLQDTLAAFTALIHPLVPTHV